MDNDDDNTNDGQLMIAQDDCGIIPNESKIKKLVYIDTFVESICIRILLHTSDGLRQ